MPRRCAAHGDLEHIRLGRQRGRHRGQGAGCRRPGAHRALRRHERRPHGRVRRSRGSRVLRLAGEAAQGRADRQRARQRELQRPAHPRSRAAKAFYGAVFGWKTFALPGGFQIWTLPGYGDYLQRDDPELRKRLAEAGGPTGFEDVVASLIQIPDDQPDTPPHWGLTFAVDDADAAAQKATELGGKVILPPMDAPWVRMTVLSDPSGATFTASKYVPENKDLG